MALLKNSSANELELMPMQQDDHGQLSRNNSGLALGQSQASNSQTGNNNNANGGTPKMQKRNAKNVQFSQPEFSVTQIPGTNRLAPNRIREEAIVMANLRRHLGPADLQRSPRRSPSDLNANVDTGQSDVAPDSRPLLPKVASKKDLLSSGEESPKPSFQDKDFIIDCLCWHNEYRARHGAPALSVSAELCEYSQKWANHLASTNEFYYRRDSPFGQNLFCCPANALLTDMSGQEVSTYWYSTVKRYDFFKEPHLLHTNVNAGHFTQMVWVNSKYFGIGKAISKTGKFFIVAYYYPPGNTVGDFEKNVLPPIMDTMPVIVDIENPGLIK